MLHLDFAQIDAKNWIIENITHQLTWNLILQSSSYGGITTVYDKLYSSDCEVYKIPTNYNYELELVQDCNFVSYESKLGDLSIFNSRNFHCVSPTSHESMILAASSFFGTDSKNNLLFWS